MNDRQLFDVELIIQVGFSPLKGFMSEEDYNSVVLHMRLTSGVLYGLPVVFDTNYVQVAPGKKILLKHRHVPIAILQ